MPKVPPRWSVVKHRGEKATATPLRLLPASESTDVPRPLFIPATASAPRAERPAVHRPGEVEAVAAEVAMQIDEAIRLIQDRPGRALAVLFRAKLRTEQMTTAAALRSAKEGRPVGRTASPLATLGGR
jgi:hypothetical protein